MQRFWTPNDFLQNSLNTSKARFRLMGYARSGQHAVSHWLLAHFQNSLWYNNICGRLEPDGMGIDFTLYRYRGVEAKTIGNKQDYLEAESYPCWDIVGLGFEGCRTRYQHLFDALELNYLPLLLVVRDIRNQAASIAKHPDMQVDEKFYSEWRENTLQALQPDANTIVVNYNQWATSREYRETLFAIISQRCGLQTHYYDGHSQRIVNIGGGSSFSGLKHDGQARSMPTLKRYQAPEMRETIAALPVDLLALDHELFGNIDT